MMESQLEPKAHDELVDLIRNEVSRSYKPGDRIPGIREWVQRLGVSLNTVRVALLMLEKEGLLVLRHGSGIYVQSSSSPLRIGIFSETDLFDPHFPPYYRAALRSLRRYLKEAGVLSKLYIGTGEIMGTECGKPDWDLIEDLQAHRLDGLAIFGVPFPPLYTVVRKLASVGDSHAFKYGVSPDWEGLLRGGISRLTAQGCRRIAVMSWSREITLNAARIITEMGLDCRPGWIKGDFEPAASGAAWSELRELWSAYPEKPDGLLVADDILFAHTIPAIQELKIRVPLQLKIVAHANKGARPMPPFPVTFAEFDAEDMARRMGELLLKVVRRQVTADVHEISPIQWIEPDVPKSEPINAGKRSAIGVA